MRAAYVVPSAHPALYTRGQNDDTHRIHLYVIEHWGSHEAPPEPLDLAEPLPARRVPGGRAGEQNTRIIRVARRARAQTQKHAAKGRVAEVQTVMQVALEGRAVQEWQEDIDAREVQVGEVLDQVRVWERVFYGIEAKGGAFPLFGPMSWGKWRGRKSGVTHSVLCPKFGSAGDQATANTLLLRAIELGFEIEGSLDKDRATGFAKEAVAEVHIVKSFLKDLYLRRAQVDIFIVTCVKLVVTRVVSKIRTVPGH